MSYIPGIYILYNTDPSDALLILQETYFRDMLNHDNDLIAMVWPRRHTPDCDDIRQVLYILLLVLVDVTEQKDWNIGTPKLKAKSSR